MLSRSIFKRFFKHILVLGLYASISACGDGSSGGSGSSGSNDTKSPTLTISKTSLSFYSTLGLYSPEGQTLIASLSNTDSLNGDVYVKITASENRFFSANASIISGSQGRIVVGMTRADDAGLGIHKGQFEVHVCLDDACNKEVKGSPKTVAVTYTVDSPSVTFEKKEILFNAKQGDRPSANNQLVSFSSIPVSVQHANTSYDGLYSKVTYQGTIQDWLTVSMNDYSHMDIAVTKSLAPGVYKAEMELQTSVPLYKSVKVPIIYTVSAGDMAIDRPEVTFNITDNNDSTALYTTIHATSLTSAKIDWEITSDQNWLSTEISNVTTEKADIKFNLNKNSAFLKNGQYHAIATISNKNDRSMFYLVSVALNADLIQFDYITPYFGYREHSQKIYAHGQGFNRLSGQKLMLNDTEITDYQIISDSKLSFTPPPLPVGNYTLSVAAPHGGLFSKASYNVIEPERYENKTISFPEENYSNYATKPLYEPVSKRIITNNFASKSIESYQFVNGEWKREIISFDEGKAPSPPFLSVDGKLLYVMVSNTDSLSSMNFSIYSVDMDTLKTAMVFSPGYMNSEYSLPLSDDELLIYGSHDKRIINFTTGLATPVKTTFFDFFSIYRKPITSMDRQYREIGIYDNYADYMGVFDRDDQSISLTDKPASRAVNSDGSIRIQNDTAVDSNGATLGKLYHQHSLMAFDMLNNRLYGYDFESFFYVYDFSRKNSAGQFEYTKISIDMQVPYYSADGLIVSPSGNSLFLITDKSLNIRRLQ